MWYWIAALIMYYVITFVTVVCMFWRKRDIKIWNGGVCQENGIKWYVFFESHTHWYAPLPVYGLRSGDIEHPVHKRVMWINPDKLIEKAV